MMISTRGRYALRVMIDLAEQDSDGYVSLREIAQRQEISEKYLETIVRFLTQEGWFPASGAREAATVSHGSRRNTLQQRSSGWRN